MGYLHFTVLSNLFTSVLIKLLIAQLLAFSGSFGLCIDIYIIVKGPLPVSRPGSSVGLATDYGLDGPG